MDYKDYYATLGVSKKASQDEVQKAYRKLARKYHPDVNREPEAEDRFKEITEAYEVLKDSEKRKVYDRFGKNWKQAQAQGFGGSGGQGFSGGVPPGFEGFRVDFGGGGGGGGGGASGYSSFFDMLFGGGNPFGDDMGGFGRGGGRRGRAGGGAADWNLRGQDHEARLALTLEEAARGGQREISLADPTTGESKTYSVTIPPGVREGQKIRLAGRGGAGAGGGGAGDLYLKVELKPHDRFRRDGNDLYVSLPVTPWDAALGAEAAVKTLNGTVTLRVPAGSSTGRKIRLRGKGLPNPKGADGDLYAEIEVVVPGKLSAEERELFEKLSEVSSFRAGAA